MDRKPEDENSPTLAQLQRAVARFVSARRWERFHAPGNLAASILIEAAELLEHFQWAAEDSGRPGGDPETLAAHADELADILIYCLAFANRTGIDPGQAVLEKLARNEARFPQGHDPFEGDTG